MAGIWACTFNAVAVSAAQDVWEVVAVARKLYIVGARLSQYSDFSDTQAELISVLVMRGHTSGGSGGSSVTPANLLPWVSGSPSFTVSRNNTTPASGGSPDTVEADSFNVAAGWSFPPPERRQKIGISAGMRAVVRITAPADALTMNSTLVIEEAD